MYGPDRAALKRVQEFKFLGIIQHESGGLKRAMEGREAPLAAALHRVRCMAAKVRPRHPLPTRIKLAAVYAVPAANYGDVVWATSHLRPQQCLHNKVQSSLLQHLRQVAGLPASAASWGVVRELQIQLILRDRFLLRVEVKFSGHVRHGP